MLVLWPGGTSTATRGISRERRNAIVPSRWRASIHSGLRNSTAIWNPNMRSWHCSTYASERDEGRNQGGNWKKTAPSLVPTLVALARDEGRNQGGNWKKTAPSLPAARSGS